MMLSIPVGVTRPHVLVGQVQVHHRLPGNDVQILGVAVREILGMIGGTCKRLLIHSRIITQVARVGMRLPRVNISFSDDFQPGENRQ